jgi:hypothetical protein
MHGDKSEVKQVCQQEETAAKRQFLAVKLVIFETCSARHM